MQEGASSRRGRFQFHLLGRFAVAFDGVPLSDREIGSRKGRTLLKLLVVERGRTVPTDRIAEALWGEHPSGKVDQNVAALVSRLRAVFGLEAISGGRGGYTFVPTQGLEVDLDEAERLVGEAETRSSGGEPSLSQTAAERALEILGPGRLLEDEPYAPWAEGAQLTVDRLLRRARRCAWRASLDLGDAMAAAQVAEVAIATDPVDEEAYRALLRAHHQGGEQGAALAVYERRTGGGARRRPRT